ncbi:hypothetical protein IFM89_003384 [Coptis chinensis]|uniref:PPM-type phosphatase domain-containing protein n=1 Tax=Coptis chinensis TaxID=261450 RepID=A0A835IUE5_9MAGN|nr:hypothetical protein IFM89_003384 [Coptis chinensis]
MAKSCKGLAMEPVKCLSESDCVKGVCGGEKTPSISTECVGLRETYFNCKRGQVHLVPLGRSQEGWINLAYMVHNGSRLSTLRQLKTRTNYKAEPYDIEGPNLDSMEFSEVPDVEKTSSWQEKFPKRWSTTGIPRTVGLIQSSFLGLSTHTVRLDMAGLAPKDLSSMVVNSLLTGFDAMNLQENLLREFMLMPDRPDEIDRVEAAGGRVINWNGYRVLGVLATSRSIGDQYFKPYVISVPKVSITKRTEKDEFVILARDGLYDVMSNEMACQVVRHCRNGQIGRTFANSTKVVVL